MWPMRFLISDTLALQWAASIFSVAWVESLQHLTWLKLAADPRFSADKMPVLGERCEANNNHGFYLPPLDGCPAVTT